MFQTAKKSLSHCDVQASADITHAGSDTKAFELLAVARTGAITVEHQTRRRGFINRPANNLTKVQIDHNGQKRQEASKREDAE